LQFIGRSGNNALFVLENKAVIVDEKRNLVSSIDYADALTASFTPDDNQENPSSVAYELATAAISDLDIKIFSNNDRLYTIPKSVQSEAKRALEWRKKHDRGGTSVGLNTARTLARGGQIGIRKIRHIAKYFPRHEVDKKGKSYEPSEPGYPSNGRIAWALWGGDAAERWASAIVARENKKAQANSITASYKFVMSDYESPEKVELNSFIESEMLPEEMAPQFFIRVRLDGTGIDRLYKVNTDGAVFVWDDAMWEDLGNINYDFHTYDKSLDDPYDMVEKIHVPVDTETAIIVSGNLDSNPMKPISISQINQEESQIFVDEMDGIDWQLINEISYDDNTYSEYEEFSDSSLTAATEPVPGTPVTNKDGNYTPEERSQKASSQVRDAVGKFAKSGGRVVIGKDQKYSGTIQSINPGTQSVKVKLDNGKYVDVPANTTESADTFKPLPQEKSLVSNKELTKGILGEPRVPIDSPNASLPGKLPQLSTAQVRTILNDLPAWSADKRTEAVSDPNTPTKTPNAYNDPSLRKFLEKKVIVNGETTYPNSIWYRPNVDPSSIESYKPTKDLTPSPGLKVPSAFRQPVKGLTSAASVGLTPETSDVPPIYMAIVSPDDPQAVMDLVSLIPVSKDSVETSTWKRKPGVWEKDDSILLDLKSPTPPPVVVLDDDTLKIVLDQIDSAAKTASAYTTDSIIASLIAAGGADRNKGNAEKLRRYWLYGKGAAKIRWNTAGDWTRCVRQLSKYMGPRAKGYCALRHKEATGMWTGDKEHRQLYGKKGIRADAFSTDFILPSEAILEATSLKARAADARNRVVLAGAEIEETRGSEFVIPLVIPEGIESGDGRKFEKGAITMRELPLPFLWQIKTGEGHSGSVVVGTIISMERVEQGIGNARGYFDTGEYGKEAERLVRGGFIRGVSADMDMFEADEENENAENDSNKKVGAGKMKITKARVMAVTLVPKPAFQECRVELADQSGEEQEEEVISDGVYVEGLNPLDASALVACGIVAGMIPVTPPKEWFDNPKLKKPTALTVTDEGQVYGHIAAWHVDHIGMSYGTRPPRSKSSYAYFHTGAVRAEDGTDVPVGQLTLAGGHASLEASASEAVRHYDDTASAVADVHAGEDAYGIWVSGALRPGTTPEQIRALRASAPSGDWRPIKGALELVAICQVNVPGFPIARARVASGQVMALVAAGASVLAQLKNDPLTELHSRIDKLEAPLIAASNSAKDRMRAITAAIKAAELSNKVNKMKEESSSYMLQSIDNSDAELAVITRKQRMELAKDKKALPDGSFPIRNVSDLKNAVHAYGRSKPGKRGLVRRHIVKMARQLDRKDLVPENWKEASIEDVDSIAASLRARISIVESVVAAGGLDRNQGNAEKLRRYWTRGEGAAKIRWGTPGDWSRCVKHLAKYLGPRAKGYCQLRHKDALGIYTATHAKRERAKNNSVEEFSSDYMPETFEQMEIPQEYLQMPVSKIIEQEDDMYDSQWNPEDEIVIILNEMGEASEADFLANSETFAEKDPYEVGQSEPVSTPDLTKEDLEGLTDEETDILKKEVKSKQSAEKDRAKYTPKTQPRDATGKFRQVLARLKLDLGDAGSDAALKKIEEVDNLDNAGNYAEAAKAAGDLLDIVDRLDTGALNAEAIGNVRNSAGELGKVIANLPFAFGADAQKIRFSDVPPALQDLMEKMITRVEDKIGKKDADIATQGMKDFMSGQEVYSQSEISSQMSKLLRLLT
jgi:uncharacterized Zn ribbon protein